MWAWGGVRNAQIPSEGWEQVAAWESCHAQGSSDMCLVSYAAPFGKCSGEQVSRPRVASLSLLASLSARNICLEEAAMGIWAAEAPSCSVWSAPS